MGEIQDFGLNGSGDRAPCRLAAIVAGDISGYSRLMQIDEKGTRDRVKRIERELIEPTILAHHGRLVKTRGNGFIAIFDSPVEAARCGIVIRQCMVERNASLPKRHWIEYRIGVNFGDVITEPNDVDVITEPNDVDVITEPNDVYGDGVNIASRLKAIAEPGQVYISGGIYEQIKHKLFWAYESLGDRKVKNTADHPVSVYRVLPDLYAFHGIQRRRENILIFLLSLALLVIASGAIWYLFGQPDGKVGEEASVAGSQETQTTVSSPPTEKPTHQVTIKPFAMSQHPVSVREWNECAAAKACGFVAVGNEDTPSRI